MVYLKYNSVKLPVLDNYNIAKSSQEITFSDLKCDFTGHQKADLPEKYQEVRVVEESKVNREIEKIEYEEKKDVKELSFESKVREKISICKVHGYSNQETREGYNLCNVTDQTKYGVTFKKMKNGILLNGKSTETFYVTVCEKTVAGGNYCIKGLGSTASNSTFQEVIYKNDTIDCYVAITSKIRAFADNDVLKSRFYIYKNTTFNNLLVPVQITKSDDKDYEPYGTMPSEEFPSKIRNVGDNINIFNKNSTFISYQTKIEVLDKGIKVINLSTVKYASAHTRLGGKELLGKTITLYSDIEESEGASANVLLYFGTESKPSSGGVIQKINNNSKNVSLWNIPSEFPDGYDRIHLYFYGSNATESTANSYVNYNNIKVEIGDTPSPYSEYNCGNIDIGLYNENIFNLEELMKISSEYSEVNDGYAFTANIKMYKTGIPLATPISLPASISYDIKNGTGTNFRFKFWFDDGTSMTLKNYASGTDDKLHNITINNFTRNGATKIIKIGIDYSIAGTFTITNFMINEGTIVKPYIKHQESHKVLELNKPLYQNCYLAEDGIHYTKTQIQLDGVTYGLRVESVTLSNTSNLYYCVIEIPKHPGVNGINNMYCSHFLPYFGIKVGSCYITNYGKYIVIVLTDQTITTVDAANTWLAAQKEKGTPVMIEYELAEEEIETYTEKQQKAWNNMQNLVSYVGINNINSSTNIDVKYPVRIKKEIVPETYDKLLYTGYIDDYVFDEMRELDEDINISFTLLSPQKIATLRTCIAVGTYEMKDLIENTILRPLIDDGFTLKEINIVNKSLTVNFLVETVEYCMNNLSNKYNFWWYIDESKNIYVKDIETMFKEEPMYIYDDKHTINGLEYVKPITNSYDYANVINFKNVRIYEYSRLRMNKKEVAEAHNPLIDGQVTNIKQNDQITFNFPIDIKKENIIKSANSNGITNTNIIYGIYVEGTYEDNTDFSFFISFDTLNNLYKISDNLGFDGESTDSEKEFLLMRDSFFSNLITGIKYNNGNKKINSIKAINSDSALIYNVNKFLNDKGILEKKNIISKTGIVERTIDMKESWKTVQELTEIGASYLNKNSLNYADELEIKLDKDKLQVGKILYINKFMIEGRYVVTEIQRTDQNNDDEFLVKCKNANILDNFIDIFRQENEQTSSDKVYQLYVTHYEEEGISERFEVVQ